MYGRVKCFKEEMSQRAAAVCMREVSRSGQERNRVGGCIAVDEESGVDLQGLSVFFEDCRWNESSET